MTTELITSQFNTETRRMPDNLRFLEVSNEPSLRYLTQQANIFASEIELTPDLAMIQEKNDPNTIGNIVQKAGQALLVSNLYRELPQFPSFPLYNNETLSDVQIAIIEDVRKKAEQTRELPVSLNASEHRQKIGTTKNLLKRLLSSNPEQNIVIVQETQLIQNLSAKEVLHRLLNNIDLTYIQELPVQETAIIQLQRNPIRNALMKLSSHIISGAHLFASNL